MKSDRSFDQIKKLVRADLDKHYHAVEVVDINVSEGFDEDGDRILFVEVVFDGSPKKLDPSIMTTAVRRLRPSLPAEHKDDFPVFSFVAKDELERRI